MLLMFFYKMYLKNGERVGVLSVVTFNAFNKCNINSL